MLTHVDEYTAPFVWATASFLVFRPARGAVIAGAVEHQAKTHITLSYLNTFPITITKDFLPEDWTFNAGDASTSTTSRIGASVKSATMARRAGFWMNELGEKIEGVVEGVRIRDYDGRMDGRGKGKGVLRIEGSLCSVEEEQRKKNAVGKGKGRA